MPPLSATWPTNVPGRAAAGVADDASLPPVEDALHALAAAAVTPIAAPRFAVAAVGDSRAAVVHSFNGAAG